MLLLLSASFSITRISQHWLRVWHRCGRLPPFSHFLLSHSLFLSPIFQSSLILSILHPYIYLSFSFILNLVFPLGAFFSPIFFWTFSHLTSTYKSYIVLVQTQFCLITHVEVNCFSYINRIISSTSKRPSNKLPTTCNNHICTVDVCVRVCEEHVLFESASIVYRSLHRHSTNASIIFYLLIFQESGAS